MSFRGIYTYPLQKVCCVKISINVSNNNNCNNNNDNEFNCIFGAYIGTIFGYAFHLTSKQTLSTYVTEGAWLSAAQINEAYIDWLLSYCGG